MTTLSGDLETLTGTLTDVLGVPVTRDPGALPGLVASYPVVVFIGPPTIEPTMTGGARLDFDCHVIRGGTGGLADLDVLASAALDIAERLAVMSLRPLPFPIPGRDDAATWPAYTFTLTREWST